ncbi:MAG: zf-HC2 domain-containing protein [Verrucomicrobia bacterium]|nr:zf-HC2 domain-containing protein [Verrucomicrobiota bacterium]
MRCHEARNLIGPYLDSELDAKTSFEIEQHLETCADCARAFEAERALDTRLFAALGRGEKTAEIWQELEAQISSANLWSRLKPARRWKLALLGASSMVSAALLAMFILLGRRPLDLAVAVAKDHRAYLAGAMAPEFAGPVPDELARTFNDRLDVRAFSTRPSIADFRTEGARVCHLSGVPVAWILGRYQGIPVSLIVLKKAELVHFPSAKRRIESGEPVICSRAGLLQFAARVVGDQVVCAVAETSKSHLEALVASVRGPG